jgi:phenylacetate-coenzyme A ligase PaaK-like adenylate-forming protein
MKITPLDSWIHRKIASCQPGLTRQGIETWQIARLNETLSLVRSRSLFYRTLLSGVPDSISSLDDLDQFPFTVPADIRRNPSQFVCVSQDEIHRIVTLQSTGTTDEPKRIYFTEDDQELTIDFFSVGMSTLTVPGDRVLILLPGETPGSVGDLLRLGLERISVEPIPYGPVRDPINTLQTMHNQRVDCLVGSPTQVLGLVRRWRPTMHKPRNVLLSTDYVPEAIVKVLEQVWECEVFNHYGATEMGLGGGVECAAHRGYHLREADLYFEIIDPKTGVRIPDGEYGEVVFTTLTRHGMPLIRYRMGDRSHFIPGECPCNTKLVTMEKVCGRFSGFITVGDIVLRLADFDEALFPIPGLLNFSIVVAAKGARESLIVETQMLTSADCTNMVRQALETIPSIIKLEVIIHCKCNPKEAGSIYKRVIIDSRGG